MASELTSHSFSQPRSIFPLLRLTSHAYATPLVPSPRLKYNLRTVPNPPKAIRDAYTGVSKRLRDHMLEHEVFVELLDRAEGEIRTEMDKVVKEWEEGRNLENDGELDNQDSEVGHGDDDTSLPPDDSNRPILVVGVFCERGKHRSVAFVEELSRKAWPKEWEVVCAHRDLEKRRSDMRGKRGGRGKAKEIDTLRDGGEGSAEW